MLRSGDSVARAALVREVSTVVLSPLDRCLEIAETRLVDRAHSAMLPLILIVGSSRAGTTFIYQVLARYLPVTYFTNLSALFPRAPLAASRLFTRRSRTGGASFHNYYGTTAGLAGPNDGFHVWNRWLGSERYRAPQTLTEDAIAGMRQFFTAWTQTFGRPLLNKNNRNADCVALLGRILPEAFFVVVRRDPVNLAQSLLIARQHVQGDKRRKWGLLSVDQQDATDPLGYVDDVCLQIAEIERKLAGDCRTLPAGRVIEVQYEHFCEDPAGSIAEISSRIWGAPVDTTNVRRELHPAVRSNRQQRVTPQEFERIQRCLRDSNLATHNSS
ncbi:MAG TPA: sulfotransferase [Gemmatimonadales bacterium]